MFREVFSNILILFYIAFPINISLIYNEQCKESSNQEWIKVQCDFKEN